jgi:hypothetical protein
MFERHEPFMRSIEEKGVRYIRVMPKEDDPTSAIGRGWKSTFNCQSKGVNALFMYVCMYICMYVCMYITCTVQHIYFTAEMYVVVLYIDDVLLLHGIFLIYDQCIYSPENRYTNIISLNTDEVRQRPRLSYMYVWMFVWMYVCMYVCMSRE